MKLDEQRFREMYSNPNISMADIAKEFSVNRSTVYEWVNTLDLPKVNRQNTKLNETNEYIKMLEKINAENGFNKNMPSYEDLISFAIKENEMMQDYYFTPTEIDVNIDTQLPIALTFTSCWHMGAMGVDYVQLDNDLQLTENTQGSFIFLGGDLRENIIQPTKMGSSHNQQPIIRQNALFIRALEKIQESIIAVGSGTHDWDTLLTGVDRISEICSKLNVVYTDMGGLLRLTVGNQLYSIFRSHHYKFQSVFNLTHACKQCWRLGEYDADIIVLEHRHQAAMEPFYGHGLERIAIRTGTYKTQDDYARANGFYGQRVGNPTVILYPNERKMVPFLHMDQGIEHLKVVRSNGNVK